MDQVAIIAHSKTKEELLNLPSLISKSNELKVLYSERQNLSLDRISKLKECNWTGPKPMTQENLLLIWEHLGEGTDISVEKGVNYYSEIDTYFGEIKVYENTILVDLFPEHKYGNLRNLITSKYIFQLNRQIAKIINSSKIVYCCSGYHHPSIIEEKSMMGWDIDSTIQFANKIFGIPPKEINEAIENLYFIDEFDIDLEQLDPEKKVWSRAKYEYEKEQINEPPYNKR